MYSFFNISNTIRVKLRFKKFLCYKYYMDKSYNQNFANKLKLLRLQKGLSQKEIASILCITPTAYSNYEQGIRFPSYQIIIVICKLFNVSSDYLLGLED